MTNSPSSKSSHLLPLAGVLAGSIVSFVGVGSTAYLAWMVWHHVDADTKDIDAQHKADTLAYFASMNHLAWVAVGVALAGLAILTVSSLALSHKK